MFCAQAVLSETDEDTTVTSTSRTASSSLDKADSPLAGLLDIRRALDNRDLGLNKILNHIIPSPDAAGHTLDTISSILPPFTRGVIARGLNINHRQVDASTHPHSPFDDIMLHLKSFSDTITDALESIINDAKVTTHDAIVAIHENLFKTKSRSCRKKFKKLFKALRSSLPNIRGL
ncbi:hypothetical protein E1B28_003761 [Marasmius oreades]|uniref:Uncharacterized protein n=1 Tax=Marasmius oreades TaxID=181124 RepID=A0A9P7UX88_9AGAR|nr:uncharacterized protein E1B28_003761 [Marasmius oreades]KAG7096316.1 hypothetical protein E1B28_003761 [Marasmius oreades]